MDNDSFDDLVRKTFAGASRRGVVRAGIGALAISTMTAIGLSSDGAEAKKKKKKKKKKKPVATCPAELPLVCGDGCCPSTYPKCCLENFGFGGGGAMVISSSPGESTCNPASFNCCPADQGGGSCGGFHSVCCNATVQQPFGDCVQAGGSCCTTEQGGGHCDADRPVCCAEDPDPLEGGHCCLAGETCCQADADCPGGGAGSCVNGCCAAGPREAGRGGGRTPQGKGERFHLKAR